MGTVSVEHYGPEGVELLARLHAAAFDKPWSNNDLFRLLDSTGVEGLVATYKDQPVGLALIRVIAGDGELLTLGTDRSMRGQGYGSQLLKYCEVRASYRQATRLILEVSTGNQVARGLYKSAHYLQIGQRVGYYRDGSTALVLSKTLKP